MHANQAGEIGAHGMYRPEYEHDSCGVGFVADLAAEPRHDLVVDAGEVLKRLEHRGAVGANTATSDGAGLLLGMPDEFFRTCTAAMGFQLPPQGQYAAGMFFMPPDAAARDFCREQTENIARTEGFQVLGWRDVPIDPARIGAFARSTMPHFQQLFLAPEAVKRDDIGRKLYILRRQAEKAVSDRDDPNMSQFYVASLSTDMIVYKGMLTGGELMKFFPDLGDATFASAFSVVHQRYSTNTLPTWSMAQPFRMLAHNGEVNTLRGNINRMRAREPELASALFEDDLEKVKPVVTEGSSDSATLDHALELLVHAGRSLPHAMMMLVPEAWGSKFHMSADKRAFYEYHSALMEPWDGPAALTFTDGRYVGANLDRNGLRPLRYSVTHDGLVVAASETGVLDMPPERIRFHGRLQPGMMLLVDLKQKRLVPDREIKAAVSRQKPYRRWVEKNRIELRGLLTPASIEPEPVETLRQAQHAFGYTEEELKMIIGPMAAHGQEAVGSMGNDTPLAVLSHRPQLLYSYFKQLFAQVTNPAIDPLREELVMSLMSFVGREKNLLQETPEHCRLLKLNHPVLTPEDMMRLRNAGLPEIKTHDVQAVFPVKDGCTGMQTALEKLFARAEIAVKDGATLLVVSDRGTDKDHAPIPMLLAASGLHHYLIRQGLRTAAGIVVETGEAREVMHFATLIGYGANAVCPYTAFATLRDMADSGLLEPGIDADTATDNYITALKKGLLKTLSRMGISTIRSFCGAQSFEAVGLDQALVDAHFTGTTSRIQGIGLDALARETLARHARAYPRRRRTPDILETGGHYHLRADGEKHLWTQETLPLFQRAVQEGDYDKYRSFAEKINRQEGAHLTLRSLFEFSERNPVPLDDVEPVEDITRRFFASAMSFGSVSKEAHEAVAVAMNRIGGRSNCGEGGEDPARYTISPDGDDRKSRVKQVASGRFGVTTEYLVNCDELQIKIAQGAKPGEGGQLPGHKASEEIARVRHTTPNTTLISPPPHHDIYSIEDLAQLIRDLKCVNKTARVSVKLVSEVGVGTIAAGVAKAQADMVQIAGYDGGTGASPLTSIKHAGIPWELGLAETQQTLRQNGLRGNIRVQVDGQLRTGRDLAVAALMGAEEFGFGTPLLVCLGCVMMRKCHANNCPVGVATQKPELRRLFRGRPEYIENYMRFLAQDLREHMARLGFRSVDEMVGHTECLHYEAAVDHWKTEGLNLNPMLEPPEKPGSTPLRCMRKEFYTPVECFDDELIARCQDAIVDRTAVTLDLPVRNTHRTIGARLSGEIVRRFGRESLPDDTVDVTLRGTAGQSLGAFLTKGVTLRLHGNANDYVGKGLDGGKIIIRPPENSTLVASLNVIAGNVILYGAIAGELYVNGLAGERFGVRNSGVHTVVEGVGDHACEYMTGGVIVVLGDTGNNFAAGMSGGVAYVYDETGLFDTRCNLDMVDIETPWDENDQSVLKALIEKHAEYTDSERARFILDNWTTHVAYFVKVMPIEYKRVLERMQEQQDREAETLSATEEVYP